MKITAYKTAQANTTAELDRQVNVAIKEGWQPFGAPYTIVTSTASTPVASLSHILMFQALVMVADAPQHPPGQP